MTSVPLLSKGHNPIQYRKLYSHNTSSDKLLFDGQMLFILNLIPSSHVCVCFLLVARHILLCLSLCNFIPERILVAYCWHFIYCGLFHSPSFLSIFWHECNVIGYQHLIKRRNLL